MGGVLKGARLMQVGSAQLPLLAVEIGQKSIHSWMRWIGLEDEARCLQLAMRTVTSEEKCSLFPGPLCVDRVEPRPRPRVASFQREPRSSDN